MTAAHSTDKETLGALLRRPGRVHFIGIGGIGTSGLAKALLARGWSVSGSDIVASDITRDLARLGAQVSIGHHQDNLQQADLVVHTDAVHDDNAEIVAARARGLPLARRSAVLGALTAPMSAFAVSGTHGKTTTAAMLAAILHHARRDPTVFLGGEYPPLGGNVRIGQSNWAVVEACEAFASFLDLAPAVALITNIEPEHLDFHGTAERMRQAFLHFLGQIKPGGAAVVCADDPSLRPLAQAARVARVIDYGLAEGAHFRAADIVQDAAGSTFTLQARGAAGPRVRLPAFGRHNILNALGAAAAAALAEVSLEEVAAALADFSGVKRRLETVAQLRGLTIMDDYAHHPTEILATLQALREHKAARLLVVFQPHLYSRTQTFMQDFARVLGAADLAWVTDIYPAREAPLPGVTAQELSRVAKKNFSKNVEYLPFDGADAAISQHVREGDIVVTMGAGNVDRIARSLAKRLSDNTAA